MKITDLKTSTKILIIATIGALIVAAVFYSIHRGGGEDTLSEAIEGGELALTSVGRNYESTTRFVKNDEAQARQLLEAAKVALENAKVKLDSASRTSDEYVLGMLDNYRRVANASDVMAQGVDNLLVICENLTNVIYCYSQKDYEKAAEQASYCLQVLTPLLSDFETSNATLNGIDVFYIPSGQRDRLTLGVSHYRGEMKIYNQYILLLRSLLEGKDYLQKNALLEEYFRQMQEAIAKQDFETAEELRQRISEILQSLRDPSYQSAVDAASQLDPSLLSGAASDAAQELLNRIRNLEGIEAFENYIQSLGKYLEALGRFKREEFAEAEQSIEEGLGILGQGRGGDPELQGLYAGLREAFNTLQLRIRSPPPPG